jgi:DNA-binding MarR family transcriptional regulator
MNPDTRALNALRRLVASLADSARDLDRAAPAQRFILEQLADGPLPSVNALAARTHTTQATVVIVLNRLERTALVARQADPNDRRRTLVSITAKGRRLLARSAVPVQSRLLGALDAMPRRQARALADALEAWVSAAGLAQTPAALFLEPPAPRRRPTRA